MMINEEGLRDWFGKSKSKDGKKGWVNVVTGDSQQVTNLVKVSLSVCHPKE